MNYFVLWFFKITAFILQAFYFRRKRIYVGKKRQSIKGTILISNHYSIYDVPFIMFTFFFRTIYFVAGEQLFQKRMLSWWVKSIGGIKCNRDVKDMTWLEKCERLLHKGKTVLIFPQSKLSPDNSAPYNHNFVVLALRSKCPVLPLYVNGKYGKKERAKIVIGTKTNINALWNPESTNKENFENIAGHFSQLTKSYQSICG